MSWSRPCWPALSLWRRLDGGGGGGNEGDGGCAREESQYGRRENQPEQWLWSMAEGV